MPALGRVKQLGTLLAGLADKTPKWLWPIFGATAAAPVVGYELERRNKRKKIDEQRRRLLEAMSTGMPVPPIWRARMAAGVQMPKLAASRRKARVAIGWSLGRTVKQADLNELNRMLQAAKQRANKAKVRIEDASDQPHRTSRDIKRPPTGRPGEATATVGSATYGG